MNAPSGSGRAGSVRLLGRCDPAWNRWYEPADSFEEARKLQFSTDASSFQKLFAQEKHQIGDGFSFGLWTGDSLEETSGVDGGCGGSSLHLPSSCVLEPFDEGPVGERILTAPVMTEVLRAMALAWEPEWGVATTDAHAAPIIPVGRQAWSIASTWHFGLPRFWDGSAPTSVLSEPARASLALRPAYSLDLLSKAFFFGASGQAVAHPHRPMASEVHQRVRTWRNASHASR